MAKILIIDDEPLTVELLRAFVRIIGHDSTDALTCADARNKLAYYAPDAILLDIMLPDMNGLDFCRELRAQPATATTPIIMISAVEPPKDNDASAVGASGYLRKPIALGQLREMLKGMGIDKEVAVAPAATIAAAETAPPAPAPSAPEATVSVSPSSAATPAPAPAPAPVPPNPVALPTLNRPLPVNPPEVARQSAPSTSVPAIPTTKPASAANTEAPADAAPADRG